MMSKIISFISGIIFGVGLSVSNMINPEKVLGFLDFIWSMGPFFNFCDDGRNYCKCSYIFFI